MAEVYIFAISLVVFLFSVILHEIAHGLVADRLGDDTARVAGRLSLNPIVHIDLIGSIILPVILYFTSGFAFGYAKPVPVDPSRLRGGASSYRLVAIAGIITNLCLAIISGVVLRLAVEQYGVGLNNLGVIFFANAFYLNALLGFFNALPFPGFDGYNFLGTFKPVANLISRTPMGNPYFMASYGLLLSFGLLILLWPFIGPVLRYLMYALAGLLGIGPILGIV